MFKFYALGLSGLLLLAASASSQQPRIKSASVRSGVAAKKPTSLPAPNAPIPVETPLERGQQLPEAGDPSGDSTGVPDYALDTFDGKKLQLSKLRGRVVLLDFFSATCPHCQHHSPVIAALAKKYQSKGLQVVNMSINNSFTDYKVVETYQTTAGIENPIVWSPLELLRIYSPEQQGVPTMVLFGKDGRLAFRHIGWQVGSEPPLETEIQQLLAVKSPVIRSKTAAGRKRPGRS